MIDAGKTLKALRIERKMTQVELAKRMNVSKQAISNYEQGIRQISLPVLEAIADIFNVPIQTLISQHDLNEALATEYSKPDYEMVKLSHDEQLLLTIFRSLDDSGKASLLRQAEMHQMMSSKTKTTSVKVKDEKPKPKKGVTI